MGKITIFMLAIGLATLGACSSNEVKVKVTDNSVSDVNNEKPMQNIKEGIVAIDKTDAPTAVVTDETPAESVAVNTNNKISICKNGSQIRTISIVYKQGDTSTSCEVTYEKITGVKSLWNAKSDMSYCETHAKAFVKKQEGWGWVCSNLE